MEFLVLFILVGYLVYEYSAKRVPLYVKLVCYFSWLTSFGIIVVIPLDIYFVITNSKAKFIIFYQLNFS